jgi:hypothetical protein
LDVAAEVVILSVADTVLAVFVLRALGVRAGDGLAVVADACLLYRAIGICEALWRVRVAGSIIAILIIPTDNSIAGRVRVAFGIETVKAHRAKNHIA